MTRSFSVTVIAVNDAPSFSAGPANESGQAMLEYTVVSNTVPELFTGAPAIDSSGTLTYTPKAVARGTATIGVVVRDSGGTANGGSDTSTVRTFTITLGGSYRVYLPLALR